MQAEKLKPATIEDYIQLAPEAAREKLYFLQDCIEKGAPGAKQELKWGMPAFSYARILVTFAAFKNHIGLYVTPTSIKKFEKQLAIYKTSKGTIQFPLADPLPLSLIRKLVKFRVKESKEEDVKWKS